MQPNEDAHTPFVLRTMHTTNVKPINGKLQTVPLWQGTCEYTMQCYLYGIAARLLS